MAILSPTGNKKNQKAINETVASALKRIASAAWDLEAVAHLTGNEVGILPFTDLIRSKLADFKKVHQL